MNLPNITITTLDLERISSLLAEGDLPPDALERLDAELARANVVEPTEVSGDVVTMNTRVRFEDELSGTTREITLVYPEEADADAGRVSVLSPVGSALLGLRVGQSIDWLAAKGRRMRYRVVAVSFQPEAAGRYDL